MLKKTLTILAALVLCLAFFVSAAEAACTSTLHPVRLIERFTRKESEYIGNSCYQIYTVTYERWRCDCGEYEKTKTKSRVKNGILCTG